MKHAVILGAGVTGLTTAHELLERGFRVSVLEREPQVGGLGGGFTLAGQRFDYGPHALYTQRRDAYQYFKDLLGDDLRPIGTKHVAIHFGGEQFPYPLRMLPALARLPLAQAAAAGRDLLWVKLKNAVRRPEADSFQSYIEAHFGRTLYRIFFHDYTEKVWGVPPSSLAANFASERIPKVRILRSLLGSLLPDKAERPAGGDFDPRQFYYPRGGMEQLQAAHRQRVEARGGVVRTRCRAVAARTEGERVRGVTVESDGAREEVACDALVSTIPVNQLVSLLDGGRPLAGPAAELRHRSIAFVYLVLARPRVYAHQWLYYHDPAIAFHRVYENIHFSDQASDDPGRTGLCAEITDHRGESDARLVERTVADLARLGLAQPGDVVAQRVVRLAEAYPLYIAGYEKALRDCMRAVGRFQNVWTTGRQGLFRYVDMDHCVLMGRGTALRVARDERGADDDIVARHAEA